MLRIAGPERVAVSPAGAALVIFHGAKNVFVNVFGLFERSGRALCLFGGELCRKPRHRHQPIGLKKASKFDMRYVCNSRLRNRLPIHQHHVLTAYHVVIDGELVLPLIRLGSFGV